MATPRFNPLGPVQPGISFGNTTAPTGIGLAPGTASTLPMNPIVDPNADPSYQAPNSSVFNPNWQPYAGMPGVPGYIQAYDPSKMSLVDYLTGKYDQSGFKQFQSEALRRGPSLWANLATLDQAAQASKARDQGAQQTDAQTAQAEDALAARGGLSSGARERTAQEGAKNYLAMGQDVSRQQGLNNLQIGMNDEQNRIQELSQLPGMEQQNASMWETAKNQDLANTVAENQARNQYNQGVYQQQLQAWGAKQQADATQHAGKK